jgi:hypothetical protein
VKITRWTATRIWAAIDKHAMDAASYLAVAQECNAGIRDRLTRKAIRHAIAHARLRDAVLSRPFESRAA